MAYRPYRQRRADDSFDGNDNVGAHVVADILRRAGVEVGYCTPATAHEHRVVLVSFTSTYDVYAYYRAVALRPEWQPGRRTHRVVGGGFGLQNPTPVRRYLDYGCFGRAEPYIVRLITDLLGGGPVHDHPSVMALPEITEVKIAQAERLYPHTVLCGRRDWTETFTGCPRACRFCHYTWARQYQVDDGAHQHGYLQDARVRTSPEVTWDQLQTYPKKAGRIRSAIDGCSERLRYAYGKRISDDDIVEGIEQLGSYGGNTTLLAYNIGSMPGETDDDRQALYAALRRPRPAARVIVVVQTTPFRPSLATPMQHCAASLTPNWHDVAATVIHDAGHLRVLHSFSNEAPWSHLLCLVAERATPATDDLFHTLCFAPRLQTGNAADRLRRVRHHYDLRPYLRRYDLDEPHPAWFLRGPTPAPRLRSLSQRLEREIAPIGVTP